MDIIDLSKHFKSRLELQVFAEQQYKTILDLQKQLNKSQLENDHLKKMLIDIVDDKKVSQLIVSAEQEIVEIQIKKIKEHSLDRELDLDEVKKLEILVKTQKLIKGKDSAPLDGKPKQVINSTEELMQLAVLPPEVKDDKPE